MKIGKCKLSLDSRLGRDESHDVRHVRVMYLLLNKVVYLMRNKLAFTYVNLANAPGYKSGRHPSAGSSINHIELIAAWSLGCRRHEYRARRGAKVASRSKPLSGKKNVR